ncbi:cellulase family glycosylhydrolase [Candidatus Gracilibacteria bacterium]|nr:cellulase family glycosylhydrolase [Candidatus Gracilibacteria bacterium]
MKQIVTLVLLFALVACGGTNTPAANAPTASSVPTSAAPEPTALPTTAVPTAAAPTSAPNGEQLPAGVVRGPDGSLQMPYLNFGVVVHLFYTDRDRVMTLANNAGFDWVRQQVVWRDIEDPTNGVLAFDTQLDGIVESVHASGRKLLVNIVQSPTAYNATNGLPDDPKALGNFVELMAQRYGDKIAAYEIWNEPNLAHENGGNIEPADVGHYVEILKEAYTRIKAVNPNAIVLAAASSSSGVTDPAIALSDEAFYAAMYTYNNGEVRNYFDVQAVHPGGAANPPDTLWPDNPSFIEGCQPAPDRCWNDDETHYFRHVENVRRWMEQYGMADKQVWITEYGWATPNTSPGYEFGNFVSLEQQAEYITGAIRRSFEEYPYIGNLFLWNMNFAVTKVENGLDPLHEQASFAILNGDWSPRPSYLAVQSLIAELKQKEGR